MRTNRVKLGLITYIFWIIFIFAIPGEGRVLLVPEEYVSLESAIHAARAVPGVDTLSLAVGRYLPWAGEALPTQLDSEVVIVKRGGIG